MSESDLYDILEMLKALADESRLAILRLLQPGEQTVGDLAKQVDLGEPTVSHHLTRLREAGFVSLRMAGNQRYYRINSVGLARFKRLAAEIELPQPKIELSDDDTQWIDALGWEKEDAQVLRDHTQGTKITHLPTKQKKLLVLLRWLATMFQAGTLYSEAEVNEVLKAVYKEDYISLRRDLVDLGYLRRERGGGKYWVTPSDERN